MSWFFAGKTDPGLVAGGPYAPFSAAHVIIAVLSLLAVFLFIRALRGTRPAVRHAVLLGAFCLVVLLNAARFTWELAVGDFDIRTSLPLQLCGIQMFALPLAIFCRGKLRHAMRAFCFSYGTVGFVLALIMPLTTMYDYPLWHFRIMQTFAYHIVLGVACLMLPFNDYIPRLNDTKYAYAVLIAAVLADTGVNVLIGSNYLYTCYLPVCTDVLPWPWYLPLLLGFAFIVGRIPFWVYHRLRCTARAQKSYLI